MNRLNKVGREEELSFMVARYLQVQYPNVLYHFDYGSGLRMTMGQAVKMKRLNRRSWPDLFIAATRYYDSTHTQGEEYHGLFIELKREGTKIYLKDSKTMVANPHLQEQALMLMALESQGYKAVFGIGFDNVKEILDNYLK